MITVLRSLALVGATALAGCATPTLATLGGTPSPMQEKSLSDVPKLAGAKEPELAPDKAATLCLAAATELEKGGYYTQAIAQCELARQHQPGLPGLSRKLAGLYAREGDLEKAVAEYKKALAASPKDADLLNDMGYCCYQVKDFTAAEKYLRQALSLKPQLQRAHANLGLALGRQENWRESLEEFKKAGSVASAHANLAAMYHAAGRDDDARRECQIALGMDAKLGATQELLAKLEEKTKEPQAFQQAEAKLASTPAPSIQVAEATLEAPSIQLQRPIAVRREAPVFKPAK